MNRTRAMVLGTSWCSDTRQTIMTLDQLGIPYSLVDIERDPEAEALVMKLNHGRRVVPTVVFGDGTILAEPTYRELVGKLGI